MQRHGSMHGPCPPSAPQPAPTACQPPHLSASCSLLLLRLPSRASTSSMKITQGCSLAARVNTALQVAHHSRVGNTLVSRPVRHNGLWFVRAKTARVCAD